jgi:uncharacterized protein YkuJ
MTHDTIFLHVRDACLDPESVTPPLMTAPADEHYTAYFENRDGEQCLVTYSPETRRFTLRHGDYDLSEELKVRMVSPEEQEAAFHAAGLDHVSRAEARAAGPIYMAETEDGKRVVLTSGEIGMLHALCHLWDVQAP